MSDEPLLLAYSGPGGPLFDEVDYPGHGKPDRLERAMAPLSAFGRLAKGQPLGKSTIIRYDEENEVQNEAPDLFQVRGADVDACALTVTLCPPECAPTGLIDIPTNKFGAEDIQNVGGTYDNYQLGNRVIPGTGLPCQWPPMVALVQWGTGGAVAQAEVDFVAGTCLNVHASIVNVKAYVPYDALLNYAGSSGIYLLKGFLSPGWSRPGNAQRTVYVGTLSSLTSLSSEIFPVPPFGKSVTVTGADPTTPPAAGAPSVTVAYVNFYADANGRYQVGTYIVNGNQPLPFRVPNGGQYFRVVGGADAATRYAAIFELGI